MPRARASPESKQLALEFACMVTTSEGTTDTSHVARRGHNSIYFFLGKCTPGVVRNHNNNRRGISEVTHSLTYPPHTQAHAPLLTEPLTYSMTHSHILTYSRSLSGVSLFILCLFLFHSTVSLCRSLRVPSFSLSNQAEFLKVLDNSGDFTRSRDRKAVKMSDDSSGAGMCIFKNIRWRNPADAADLAYLHDQHKFLGQTFEAFRTPFHTMVSLLLSTIVAWDRRGAKSATIVHPNTSCLRLSSDPSFLNFTSSEPSCNASAVTSPQSNDSELHWEHSSDSGVTHFQVDSLNTQASKRHCDSELDTDYQDSPVHCKKLDKLDVRLINEVPVSVDCVEYKNRSESISSGPQNISQVWNMLHDDVQRWVLGCTTATNKN